MKKLLAALRNIHIPVVKTIIVVLACLALVCALLIKRGNLQLLEPAGYIAGIQSRILATALIMAAIIASCIIGVFFYVVLHYREGKGTKYTPEWTTSSTIQLLAWVIPFVVICGISIVLWNTAHMVDPFRAISSANRPVTIQVVALRWKWLFIYPNDRIATVNTLEIPVDTPVQFQLTADAPMNSFWIPRLSGQVYAMTGMVTQLHIEADKTGSYAGSPAEMSGDEFAGMTFNVKAVPTTEYQAWKASVVRGSQMLDYASYAKLAEPSGYVQPTAYQLQEPNLFDVIVMKYMAPGTDPSTLHIKGATI